MNKILNKFLIPIFSIILLFCLTTNLYASDTVPDINIDSGNNTSNTEGTTAEGKTTLEIVEDTVCTITVDDLAKFEKKITAFDETEKSVTLTLSLTNLKNVEEKNMDVEIFFVIDNSKSMTESYVGDKTRKQAVLDSASSLVDKIYSKNASAKIGIVGFSSLDTSAGEKEGTIDDSTLITGLTNDSATIKNAIKNLENLETGIRTNIDAGITRAYTNFSTTENVQRYIILLTDGVPNNDTNEHFSEYSDEVLSATKSKLETVQSAGISIISAMIDLSDEIEPTTQRTYKELAEDVFGTIDSPTTDVYYYIENDEIENTIVNDIFDNLVIVTDNTLKNITITDYFPQEIIDNFNFEYVASPNIGEVSETINTQNNSITWNIELLSEGETATLSYKLTLKDDYNKEIIDVILKTNDHVTITGETPNGQVEESSEDSPTIRVDYEEPIITPEPEPEPEPEIPDDPKPEPEPDDSTSPDPLPQTGDVLFTVFVVVSSVLAVIGITRYIQIRKLSR